MNIKQKSEVRSTANEYRHFIESNIVRVNRFYVLIYSNQDERVKRFNGKKRYLRKGIIKN